MGVINIEIDKEVLERLLKEIKLMEAVIDGEFGMCRSGDELEDNGELPDCYYEAKSYLNS